MDDDLNGSPRRRWLGFAVLTLLSLVVVIGSIAVLVAALSKSCGSC